MLTTPSPTRTPTPEPATSAGAELIALGWRINARQHEAVHLAARYDEGLEWFEQGHSSAAAGIGRQLDMHASTAREWIRVGHNLRDLPMIDAAFAANELSYAKVRILTRWADPENEEPLLAIAHERPAHRLTTALAEAMDMAGDHEARDRQQHEARCFTSHTDADGMTVLRIVLPPQTAKPMLAAVDELVRQIAATPFDNHPGSNASADAPRPQGAASPPTSIGEPSMKRTLRELRRRWLAAPDDEQGDSSVIPSLAQQRADAFVALFLRLEIGLTTEVVIHVRADQHTFDDGTPLTTSAVTRQLDDAFIRLLQHDAERRPINASSRRRHPTTRQARVVMEAHGHECVDCASTSLLELDHNPPYEVTRHTVTDELEPRCAPCHRARHRRVEDAAGRRDRLGVTSVSEQLEATRRVAHYPVTSRRTT